MIDKIMVIMKGRVFLDHHGIKAEKLIPKNKTQEYVKFIS